MAKIYYVATLGKNNYYAGGGRGVSNLDDAVVLWNPVALEAKIFNDYSCAQTMPEYKIEKVEVTRKLL